MQYRWCFLKCHDWRGALHHNRRESIKGPQLQPKRSMVVYRGFVLGGSYNQSQCIIQVAMSSKWKRGKRYPEFNRNSAHIDSVGELDPCASVWRCRHQHDHLHDYRYRHTGIHNVGPSSGVASSSPANRQVSSAIACHHHP